MPESDEWSDQMIAYVDTAYKRIKENKIEKLKPNPLQTTSFYHDPEAKELLSLLNTDSKESFSEMKRLGVRIPNHLFSAGQYIISHAGLHKTFSDLLICALRRYIKEILTHGPRTATRA